MSMYSPANLCSHVHSIHPKEKPSKESGNLYLSGIAAFNIEQLKQNTGINCVLTIIDSWSFKD